MTIENTRKPGPELSPAKRALLEKWKRGGAASTPASQTIPLRPQNEPIPLTFAQQRLWFLDQFVPDSPAYNIPGAIRIQGKLDFDALKRSLDEIMRRHAVLRTTFSAVDGQPFQQISPDVNFTLHKIDLRGLTNEQREDEVRRLSNLEAQKPFDLAKGPLFRASIIRQMDDDYVLFLNMHHIISDGWSIDILLKEIVLFYQAFSSGKPWSLPELPVQYADFAYWQRQWLQGAELERQVSFWKQELADAPTVLELPADRPRSLVQTFRGAAQSFAFPAVLSTAIKGLAQQEGTTLFMLLMAAFQTLLYRYSGQTDMLIGTPIANRTRIETEGLIGFFANTLVLRADLSGNPGFRELLQRVKEKTLNAYAHQDIPFEKLVEELHPERDTSRNPLFQVMFVLQNTPASTIEMPELRFGLVEANSATAKFDLWLSMTEIGDRMEGTIEYSTDLFDAVTIERLLGHFQMLLSGIVEHPEMQIADLPLLTETERHQLLVEWNDTSAAYPYENCLHRLIEEQVERTPETIALIFEGQSLTYRELSERANRLAHFLQSLGVGPETLVGLCAERSPDMVIGLLGILKAGGAYVPLDPGYPTERLTYMLEDSQVSLLLTQEALLALLPEHSVRVVCLDRDWASIETQSAQNPVSNVSPANLAYMIYTSGSTGKPKGAMNTHRAICNRLLWMQDAYPLGETDRVLQKTPFSFDVSVWEFFWPLLTGARLVLAKPEGQKDASYLVSLIVEQQITTLHFVPSMFGVFLEEPGLENCLSLRRVICSGEALPYEFQERFFSRVKAELHNLYGPTEAAVDVTYWACNPEMTRRSIPIGRPIANTQIYILDPQEQPTPIGVPGELHIGGIGVGRGYRNRPALTAEKFVPNPFLTVENHAPRSTVHRLYRTGDLARWLPDGNIEYLGRLDFQVKLRGFRIELGEIEATLRQYSAVRDAAVLICDVDETIGISNKRLVAYIVPLTSHNHLDTVMSVEQVAQWEAVFDENYKESAPPPDPTFNIAGWNSSYTGEPIPAEEMQAWVDQTIKRIQTLKPRRILEIGCGTGLLLFRLAPDCDRYLGHDVSETALRYLSQQLAAAQTQLPQVELAHKPAHDFSGLETGSVDTIVLNSVVQYFPSIEYLAQVIKDAVKLLPPDGHIFIGDVRSFPLLEAFHTSVELHRAPATLTIKQLRQRIQKRILQDQELVISPAFFQALSESLPQIARVEIQLKRGRYDNELSHFRYDVILRVGTSPSPAESIWLDWESEELTPALLRSMLAETLPAQLGITGIPNARVMKEVRAVNLLNEQRQLETVGELQDALHTLELEGGVDPEDLWSIGDDLPYDVQVSWLDADAHDQMNALLTHRDLVRKQTIPGDSTQYDSEKRDYQWNSYASHPVLERMAARLIPELRSYLKEKLPEYMIPAIFMIMADLPFSPNGKLDRQALPHPLAILPDMESDFVAPRTPTEETLADIWCQVLRLEKVGVLNNFFEIGGDSIRSIQIISRAKQAGLHLTPKQLFQHPTIAELAVTAEKAAEIAIETVDEQPPLPFSLIQMDYQALALKFNLRDVDDIYPCSPYQRHMIQQVLSAPEPGLYVWQRMYSMAASIDVAVCKKALQALVNRHPIMRTTFVWEGLSEPLQVVHKQGNAMLEAHDWRKVKVDQREAKLAAYVDADRARGFSLTTSGAIRLSVIQLANDSYYVVMSCHYLRVDGWSSEILSTDFFAFYQALAMGQQLKFEPILPYSNYLAWLKKQDQGPAENFWQKTMAGVEAATPLVRCAPNNRTGQSEGFNRQHIYLSAETTKGLLFLARQYHLTLNTLMQGTWALLLSHYSGQTDVNFGVVVAGRPAGLKGIESTIGLFINMLPMRLSVSGETSLPAWLKNIQSRQVEMSEFEHLSLERIKEVSGTASITPLFESVMVYQSRWVTDSTTAHVFFAQMEYPLRIDIFPQSEIALAMSYYRRCFDIGTINQMLNDFRAVLETLLANPNQTVGSLLDSSLSK